MRLLKISVALLALAGALGAQPIRVVASEHELAIRNGTATVFSERQAAAARWRQLTASGRTKDDCTLQRRSALLSRVGPIATITEREIFSCAGELHPEGGVKIRTMDASRAGAALRLESWLQPTALRDALQTVPEIKSLNADSLEETWRTLVVERTIDGTVCSYMAPKGPAYSLLKAETDSIELALYLEADSAACRNTVGRLVIRIPKTAIRRADVKAALTRNDISLDHTQDGLPGKDAALLEYKSGKGSPHVK